jgi:membrane protease YdiL (CAAX protease family)
VRALFINSNNDLRTGWRLAIYLVVLVALGVATGIALVALIGLNRIPPGVNLSVLALNAVGLFLPALGSLLFMSRVVDRLPVIAFGVGLHERWHRDLAAGVGVAASMLMILLAGSAILGVTEIRWTAAALPAWAATVAVLALAAANEELLFRGYALQVLMKGIGKWGAMILMSLVFGLLHATNPDATALGILNTFLAGILLSLAYLKTRSLWLPFGIHVAWNVGLGPVLGFPVSGIDLVSLWTTRVEGSPTILGGAYGPEGGVIGTVIFAVAATAVPVIRALLVSPGIHRVLTANAHKLYVEDRIR